MHSYDSWKQILFITGGKITCGGASVPAINGCLALEINGSNRTAVALPCADRNFHDKIPTVTAMWKKYRIL